MKKRFDKKTVPVLLALLLLATLLPMQAYAAGPIDTDADASLTVTYRYGSTVLPGVQFDAYRVADVSFDTQFTLTGDFRDYPVSVDGLDAAGWNELAVTLKGYVQADSLTAFATGTTDENGTLRFSGKPGLYLIIGKGIVLGEYSYTCAPFIACLPDMDTENNAWNYDVTANPKAARDKDFDPTEDTAITRKVLKVWEDHGYTDEIPQEIEVTLFCDGEVYDTVSLSKENNWRYTWDTLERGHDWTLTEETVEGYTVKITQEGQTFVVTNTNRKAPATSTPTSGGKLPQTGVLWWPVPILLMLGLVFVGIGLYDRKRKENG